MGLDNRDVIDGRSQMITLAMHVHGVSSGPLRCIYFLASDCASFFDSSVTVQFTLAARGAALGRVEAYLWRSR